MIDLLSIYPFISEKLISFVSSLFNAIFKILSIVVDDNLQRTSSISKANAENARSTVTCVAGAARITITASNKMLSIFLFFFRCSQYPKILDLYFNFGCLPNSRIRSFRCFSLYCSCYTCYVIFHLIFVLCSRYHSHFLLLSAM